MSCHCGKDEFLACHQTQDYRVCHVPGRRSAEIGIWNLQRKNTAEDCVRGLADITTLLIHLRRVSPD